MSSLIDDFKNSFLKRDVLMKLILINAIIYVVSLLFSVTTLLLQIPNPFDLFSSQYLMLPANVNELIIHPWTLITYMFLHAGIFHVLFNMLVLYWFGGIFQEYLGSQKFIYTYFLSGIFGGLFYVLCYNVFPYFSDTVNYSKALGASAAVMGIVFGAATLLPDFSVVLAIFGAIRLKYIAFFYLLIDLVGISGSNSGGHLAHIGGALFGFIYIKQLQQGNDWTKYPVKLVDYISGLFAPKKLKVAYKNPNHITVKKAAVSQEEVDKILDKISKDGYEKLTAKEKEILFKAGKQ
jgi:membrane associated rhomboid family serine protease